MHKNVLKSLCLWAFSAFFVTWFTLFVHKHVAKILLNFDRPIELLYKLTERKI
nr:MAG TPA: hypothetical protein [Caudoviricetes sp.]